MTESAETEPDLAAEHDAAIRRMEASNRRYNRAKLILTVATLLAVLAGFYLINRQGNDQRDRIISCTTPEGECSQRNFEAFKEAQIKQQKKFQRMLDEQTDEILRGVAELLLKP